MTTMNDILSRMPKGYNIIVYNMISGRLMDDFIWDGQFARCKLDISLTHCTDVDKIDILALDHYCLVRLYIFDYAYLSEFLEYCCRLKLESKIDKKVTLAVVTRDGNIDTYEVENTIAHSAYIKDFERITDEKYKDLRLRHEKNVIDKFSIFESKDGSLIVTVFL